MTKIIICSVCGKKSHTKDPNRPRTTDGRNIIDKYFGWTNEDINKDLRKHSNNFSVVICNIEQNINVGAIIRSANAFGAHRVILYGSKRYDRRATCGTHHYCDMIHCKDINNLKNYIHSCIQETHKWWQNKIDVPTHQIAPLVIGIDKFNKWSEHPEISNVIIKTFKWPKKAHTIMVFGSEVGGIPEEVLNLCDTTVYIPQQGSIRNLNLACAASIVMYDYVNKI